MTLNCYFWWEIAYICNVHFKVNMLYFLSTCLKKYIWKYSYLSEWVHGVLKGNSFLIIKYKSFFFFSFFSYYGHQGDENTDSSLAEKQVDKLLNFIAMHFFDFFFFDEMDSYHFCYILTIKKKSVFLVH